MVHKSHTHLSERISAHIRQIDPKAEIILFGSRARGVAGKYSDWDLLILTQAPLTLEHKQNIRKALYELELESAEVISAIIRQKKEWERLARTALYQNIKEEGVKL